MLKRKWIIDGAGRLVGIWTDCREYDFTVTLLNEEVVLTPARKSGTRHGASCHWTGAARRCRSIRLLLSIVSFVFPLPFRLQASRQKLAATVMH